MCHDTCTSSSCYLSLSVKRNERDSTCDHFSGILIQGECFLPTCRPTLLLWIFMRAWISLGDPRESSQSLEKRSPKRTSWLQPPHSQVSCSELKSSGRGLRRPEGWVERRLVGRSLWRPLSSEDNDCVTPKPTPPFCRVCSCSCVSFSRILSSSWRRLASQPHPRSLPRLQAEATEWATPAANMASEKALSRKPGYTRHRAREMNSNHLPTFTSCPTYTKIPLRTFCYRTLPLLRMVLWWGTLPRPSKDEQFQRWSRSWYWHSWMATWMPCRAEAVASGLRTHIRIWRLLRPASFRHTEFGVSTGSPATFRLRMSLHSTLRRQEESQTLVCACACISQRFFFWGKTSEINVTKCKCRNTVTKIDSLSLHAVNKSVN